MIVDVNPLDALAHRLDDAGPFVAEDDRTQLGEQRSVADCEVGMAHSGTDDADENFPSRQGPETDLLDLESGFSVAKHRRGRGHACRHRRVPTQL